MMSSCCSAVLGALSVTLSAALAITLLSGCSAMVLPPSDSVRVVAGLSEVAPTSAMVKIPVRIPASSVLAGVWPSRATPSERVDGTIVHILRLVLASNPAVLQAIHGLSSTSVGPAMA